MITDVCGWVKMSKNDQKWSCETLRQAIWYISCCWTLLPGNKAFPWPVFRVCCLRWFTDGTKPLPSMLTVRSNDIDLRSISQEILQPTITNISFKIVHLNIQFNLTGANQLKINILPIKITKEIYFHKKNFSINTTIDISLLALSVKHHDIPGCAY